MRWCIKDQDHRTKSPSSPINHNFVPVQNSGARLLESTSNSRKIWQSYSLSYKHHIATKTHLDEEDRTKELIKIFQSHTNRNLHHRNEICEKTLCDEEPLLQNLLQTKTTIESWSKNMLMLGFRDHGKVNGIRKATLHLVIVASIENHIVLGSLVEDGSLCNVLYDDTLRKLELHHSMIQ